MQDDDGADGASAGYRPAGPEETVRGNRMWWEHEADAYLAEHGEELAGRFVWGPEGLDEATAALLGDTSGKDVLEVGAGAVQCGTWLAERGARVAALDLSAAMLRAGGTDGTGGPARVQADARRLPFTDGAFDLAFSAYGAVPFVADPDLVMTEVARVLRPGGRWVFSVTHPLRWAFPDDGGHAGLTAVRSYFDRTPYVETDASGAVAYAEHHRTLGDRVRELVSAGFILEDLVEPEWPPALTRSWGGWSPLRGRLLPGTAVFVCRRP